MSGPLTLVLDAVAAGGVTLADIEARTGLPRDVVRTGVDHLVRLGRLEAEEFSVGCPSGGCGSCPVAATGVCGGTGVRTRGGPVRLDVPVRPTIGGRDLR